MVRAFVRFVALAVVSTIGRAHAKVIALISRDLARGCDVAAARRPGVAAFADPVSLETYRRAGPAVRRDEIRSKSSVETTIIVRGLNLFFFRVARRNVRARADTGASRGSSGGASSGSAVRAFLGSDEDEDEDARARATFNVAS